METTDHKGSKSKAVDSSSESDVTNKTPNVPAFDPSFFLERRAARVVAEETMKYSGDAVGCPLPGCDSKGMVLLIINECHGQSVIWVGGVFAVKSVDK